jgi:uncharacterized membrane protein
VAKERFAADRDALPEPAQRVIHHYGERRPISRDTNREFDNKMTFGQRLADQVATFGGSWMFILLCAALLLSWVLLNSFILARRGGAFDPYLYMLLNLFLSLLAAIQAPVILMSQSHPAGKERRDAAHDYEGNLKAEPGILSLHEKLDELREKKWGKLLILQREQTQVVTQLLPNPGEGGEAPKNTEDIKTGE